MTTLGTLVDPASDAFAANAEHNRALAAELRTMAAWLGLPQTIVAGRGDLAASLARALA